MACLLIGRKNEDLTDPVSFLYRREPKDILGKHTDHVFASFTLEFFVNHVVNPGIDLLKYEGDSVDVEQE